MLLTRILVKTAPRHGDEKVQGRHVTTAELDLGGRLGFAGGPGGVAGCQGVRPDDEVSLVLSVVLGALFVGYVSAGVVRARTVRLVLVGVLGGLVGPVDDGLDVRISVADR